MAFGRFERLVAWRYLRPTQGRRLHLGHRRFRAGRHRPRRRHADRRAGGDERLSRRAPGPRARRQRPCHGGQRPRRASRASTRWPHGCSEVPGVVERHALCRGPGDGRARNGVAVGALVRGVRPGELAGREVIAGNSSRARPGRPRARPAPPRSAAGWRSGMGLGLGSQLTLISPKGAATAFGTCRGSRPSPWRRCSRSGCTSTTTASSSSRSADAQAYFQLPERVNAIEVMVDGARADRRLPREPSRQRARPRGCGWSTGSSSTRTSSPRCRSSGT